MDNSGVIVNGNENGYRAIADYIRRYWEHCGYGTVIISIGTSYDNIHYRLLKDVASPSFELGAETVEFLNDWWEGEKYIRLFGIKSLEEIDVCGGIYEN